MEAVKRYRREAREGGLLYGLEPISAVRVAAIAAEHPGISQQYMDFIAHIGVGSCKVMNLYEPLALEAVTSSPSYKLYQGPAYRRLFNFRPKAKAPEIPAGAVMFADCGASWRYCFGPNMGSEVFCVDMSLLELEPEASDFYEFVNRGLDLFAR